MAAKHKKILEVILLILAIACSLFLRAQYFSGLYYDHDEAGFAYDALRVMEGKTWYYPWQWGDKPPGITMIFIAAFYLFGKTFLAAQAMALLFNIGSIILIYYLARLIFSSGIITGFIPLFYALLSNSQAFVAQSIHAETFLPFFEILALVLLGLGMKKSKSLFYALSGLALGCAFLIKQTAVFLYIASVVLLFIKKNKKFCSLKDTANFCLMFFMPTIAILAYFFFIGEARGYFIHTFILPHRYYDNVSVLKEAYQGQTWQWIFYHLGFEVIFFTALALTAAARIVKNYKTQNPLITLILLWALIVTAVYIKLGFHFKYHFLQILPAFVILAFSGVQAFLDIKSNKKRVVYSIIIFLLMVVIFDMFRPFKIFQNIRNNFLIASTKDYDNKEVTANIQLHNLSPQAAKRFEIATYIKSVTKPEDSVFVWDDYASGAVYLWSGRNNPFDVGAKYSFLPKNLQVPFFSTFSHNDYRENQRLLLDKLKANPPLYIAVISSYLPVPDAPFDSEQFLIMEKDAFAEFFVLLNKKYTLEKKITGAQAWRRSQ